MTMCQALSKIMMYSKDHIVDRATEPEAEAFMGISRQRNRDWPGWPLVDEAKCMQPGHDAEESLSNYLRDSLSVQEHVFAYYRDFYWIPLVRLSFFDRLTTKLFDATFLLGWSKGITILQRAVNQFPGAVRVAEDGVPSKKTLEAVRNITNQNNGEQQLIESLCVELTAELTALAETQPEAAAHLDNLAQWANSIPD